MLSKNKLKYSNKFQLMRLLATNLFTTFISVFLFISLTAIISLKGNADEKIISYFMYPIVVLVAFINAYVLSRIIKVKGYIVGIVSNAIFILSFIIINLSLSDKPFSLSFFIKVMLIIISGVVGGILGVNHKKKNR